MRRERLMGGCLGIVGLVSVFLLPFSSAISVVAGSQETLYNIFIFFVNNIGSVLKLPSGPLVLIALLYLVGAILLMVAGVIGSLNLLSGILGVAGMTMLTISGLFSPQYTPASISYGYGFYFLWAIFVTQVALFVITRNSGTRALPLTESGSTPS